MKTRVAVFGGSGFLGSHVADALTAAGYKVVIYDMRVSPWLKEDQEMIVGDILDVDAVEKTVDGCAIVYNFAGIADLDEASKRRIDSIKYNVLGNAIILEACCKAAVSRYIFASSLYVYSNSGLFYRSTKQACELFIENYHSLFGIPYTILRYGSLYGPRADKDNFIENMLKQALHEGVITREGNGEELREYIHIYDAAQFSIDILTEEFSNQHVIITGNQPMKIKDLLLMVREMIGQHVMIKYIPIPPTDTSHYEITPYNFTPKIARRLISSCYLDLGQGILASIQRLHNELNPPLTTIDTIIKGTAP